MKKTSFKIAVLGILPLFFLLPSVASAGTLRKPPNNLGLVAYWPFNEGGGSVAGDASGNGNIGTFKGTTAFPVWSAGKLGGGLSLDVNNNNRVTITPITTGNTNTISAWIYLTSDCTNYGAIFAQDGVEGLYCYQNGGGTNKLDFWYASTPADHFSNTPLALNRWYHVAIVNNAGNATFYLNGVADGTVTSVPSFNANTMGGDTLTETLPGKLDEVRLYNRALSASNVYALYKSGAVQVNNSYKSPGTLRTGITAHYTFDGKDMINKVENVSGTTGRRGTLTNFTSTTTVPGKVGQALKFDGINDYVASTAISNFISAATGTVSVWLRPTGNTQSIASAASIYGAQNAVSCDCIASWGITRANRTDLGQDRIWVWMYSTPQIGITYNRGEWVHITLVHTDGVLYAYKNGDLVSSAVAGNFGNFSGNFNIGRSWSASPGYWSGDIDEVRTYSRGLSATEIKQLYNLTLGTKVNKTSTNSLTNGLVGHWTFDGKDMYSNVADISGNGNHGILSGFTSTTTTIGKIGQALNFSGSNSVDIPMTASLSPLAHDYAISLWYKGVNGSFIGGPDLFNSYIQLDEAQATFFDVNGGVAAFKTYTLPSDNDWHHLVAVLDRNPSPDTVTVYIDGVSQGAGSDILDGESIGFSGTLHLGKGSWAGSNHFGPMDEVRIYNRTLSAAEALQLYRLAK